MWQNQTRLIFFYYFCPKIFSILDYFSNFIIQYDKKIGTKWRKVGFEFTFSTHYFSIEIRGFYPVLSLLYILCPAVPKKGCNCEAQHIDRHIPIFKSNFMVISPIVRTTREDKLYGWKWASNSTQAWVNSSKSRAQVVPEFQNSI